QGKAPLLAAELGILPIGGDAELERAGLVGQRAVDRAMGGAPRGARPAAFSGLEHGGHARGILLDQGAARDIGEDLEVFSRMELEARSGSQPFLVEGFE